MHVFCIGHVVNKMVYTSQLEEKTSSLSVCAVSCPKEVSSSKIDDTGVCMSVLELELCSLSRAQYLILG